MMGLEMKLMARQRREEMCQMSSSTSSSEEGSEVPAVRRKPVARKRTYLQKRGMTLGLTSGVLASIAGTFAKLAVNQTETILICEQFANYYLDFPSQEAFILCNKVSLYLRITSFAAMILINTVMWTTFVKALRYCNTSLEATAINLAANFFSSAVIGRLVFEESVSPMWYCGTIVIVFGLFLMNHGTKDPAALKERRKKFKSR